MKLTRRGKIVFTLLALAGLALIVWASGHIWYTSDGWCIGSLSECVGLQRGGVLSRRGNPAGQSVARQKLTRAKEKEGKQ